MAARCPGCLRGLVPVDQRLLNSRPECRLNGNSRNVETGRAEPCAHVKRPPLAALRGAVTFLARFTGVLAEAVPRGFDGFGAAA